MFALRPLDLYAIGGMRFAGQAIQSTQNGEGLMVIGALPQAQQSHSLKSANISTISADGIGNMLPPGSSGESVEISESGRSALEREMRNIAEARDNQVLMDLRGHEGNIRLGLMALGQFTMDDWSSKGLQLSEESVLAAAQAFQSASRANFEKNGLSTAGSSIALNKHQIVINSQAVPDWFVEEYVNTLSSMESSKLKSAFENGKTFYVSQPSSSNSDALRSYAEVQYNKSRALNAP